MSAVIATLSQSVPEGSPRPVVTKGLLSGDGIVKERSNGQQGGPGGADEVEGPLAATAATLTSWHVAVPSWRGVERFNVFDSEGRVNVCGNEAEQWIIELPVVHAIDDIGSIGGDFGRGARGEVHVGDPIDVG